MRAARFTLSGSMLADLLVMPATATFTHAEVNDEGDLLLTVHDSALPEADLPHETTPTIHREVKRWDWGITDTGAPDA